eukprot:20931_4
MELFAAMTSAALETIRGMASSASSSTVHKTTQTTEQPVHRAASSLFSRFLSLWAKLDQKFTALRRSSNTLRSQNLPKTHLLS